jgi:hypothetical protein
MIIKVHSTGNNDSWRYYDNAKEVQFVTYDSTDESFITQGVAGHVIEESFVKEDAVTNDMTFISFLDSDGVPRHIFTNTETYLMTDAGKTIERIA